MATYGEGDPTDNAQEFYDWLKETSFSLDRLKYTVNTKIYSNFHKHLPPPPPPSSSSSPPPSPPPPPLPPPPPPPPPPLSPPPPLLPPPPPPPSLPPRYLL